MIFLVGDPIKCKERDSTFVAEDRMSTNGLAWSIEPTAGDDGLKQMDKDRI